MLNASWSLISNFESSDLVKIRYQVKHDRMPNAAHAREIASSFIQARHYYEAASNADRAIKPLLLYYGIVSLARGLILYLTPSMRESALAKSHGLSIKDWQSVLSKTGAEIGSLEIECNRTGTFVELIKATKNRNLNRARSNAVDYKTTLNLIPAKSSFSLLDLLARLPDIHEQFSRWKTPLYFSQNVTIIPDTNAFIISVSKQKSYITKELVFDVLGTNNSKLISDDAEQVRVATTTLHAIITDYVAANSLGIGCLYLAKLYDSNLAISKLGQLFAISYILGMLVRYYPTFWMDLIHQRIGDVALPTIFSVIGCLETLFPKIIVDFLEE